MNPAHLYIFLWLFLPALFVSFVWWSWAKGRREKKGWRQAATLVSATATTANLVLVLEVLSLAHFDDQSTTVFGDSPRVGALRSIHSCRDSRYRKTSMACYPSRYSSGSWVAPCILDGERDSILSRNVDEQRNRLQVRAEGQ
jgi:hypothetical protein